MHVKRRPEGVRCSAGHMCTIWCSPLHRSRRRPWHVSKSRKSVPSCRRPPAQPYGLLLTARGRRASSWRRWCPPRATAGTPHGLHRNRRKGPPKCRFERQLAANYSGVMSGNFVPGAQGGVGGVTNRKGKGPALLTGRLGGHGSFPNEM